MSFRARLLRRFGAAAAVLALCWWVGPRLGVVFIGGWSMAPSLSPGDLMVYRKVGGRPSEGDMVLVRVPGSAAFVHRVVLVRLDESLRTKGDANDAVDAQLVAPDDVAGVAVAVVPSGRALHALVTGLCWCYNHVPIANTRR